MPCKTNGSKDERRSEFGRILTASPSHEPFDQVNFLWGFMPFCFDDHILMMRISYTCSVYLRIDIYRNSVSNDQSSQKRAKKSNEQNQSK